MGIRVRIVAATMGALAVAAIALSSEVAAPADGGTRSCTRVALAPLPLLDGKLSLVERGGFSNPRLKVRWKAPALPASCVRAGLRRSLAVQVRFKSSGSHGVFIAIGHGHGVHQWLTFDRSPKADRRPRSSLASAPVFSESLGCVEKVIGLARYRLVDSKGHVVGQKVRPYTPIAPLCSAGAR